MEDQMTGRSAWRHRRAARLDTLRTEFQEFDTELAAEDQELELSRTSPDYVRWIQRSLNQILGTRLAVDGVMGPATRAAVRTFQQRRGLTADGIVGPVTERALSSAGASPLSPASAAPAAPRPAAATNPTTGLVTRGISLPAAPALSVANFLDPSVPRLGGRSRPGRRVTELLIHETVTRSVADTVSVLQQRGLSVHLIMGPDGALTQHGDLGDEILWHASQHNGVSFGVEVVNPYYPRNLRDGLAWQQTIPAGWAHQGRYVLPTPAQAEATARLVAWTTSPAAYGLTVPRRWAGVSNGRMLMGRVPGAETPDRGIYAHTYFNHADGAWLILYAWLRLEAGMDAATAYAEAARLGSTSQSSIVLPAIQQASATSPELALDALETEDLLASELV